MCSYAEKIQKINFSTEHGELIVWALHSPNVETHIFLYPFQRANILRCCLI